MIQKSYVGKLLLCCRAHKTVPESVEKLSEAISSYQFCIMTPLIFCKDVYSKFLTTVTSVPLPPRSLHRTALWLGVITSTPSSCPPRLLSARILSTNHSTVEAPTRRWNSITAKGSEHASSRHSGTDGGMVGWLFDRYVGYFHDRLSSQFVSR